MPKYIVHEKQSRVVAHEVEAQNEEEACYFIYERDFEDYSYVVDSFSGEIQNVELTEE